jgi:site-specific DNA-methyltransferase (cytosine-N4-specific)
MDFLTCRIKGYIQPFERQLALQELRALSPGDVIPVDGDEASASLFSVPDAANLGTLRNALAYWQEVGTEPDGLTIQIRREATWVSAHNGGMFNGLIPSVPAKLPKKRCLRYATHGLHEYRGKFFPQLVRALINIAQVPDNGIVLDPMCGSGTTLVETRLAGRAAYGLDMNPLSVFIAKVKCQALALNAASLMEAYGTLQEVLCTSLSDQTTGKYFASLPRDDQAYLERWFAAHTLMELDQVIGAVQRLPTLELQDFYRICLSNILRSVSWQKNEDLRVRKQVVELRTGEVITRFLNEALRSTKIVAAFLAERDQEELGTYTVQEADARQAMDAVPTLIGKVDAVITSPPYATALPYIDTDRLSLIYLGLLRRANHRARDGMMIGNREVTERCRAQYWAFYEKNKLLLPTATRALIERIDRLNKATAVGFRRRNMSALLSKYFFDMHSVIKQTKSLLRPGGMMFLVIGNNRTTAGREVVEIRTADHLTAIAETLGFKVTSSLPMDMLASRDIFRKNAMKSEHILTLEKPQ